LELHFKLLAMQILLKLSIENMQSLIGTF